MEYFSILPEPVRSIRSKYYVGVLLQRLEIKRVAQIPAALDRLLQISGVNSFLRYRSDLFRYWNGANIKNPRFVSEINHALPGTARILNHPVWKLISEPIFAENDLVRLAQVLDPGLHGYIIEYNEQDQEIRLKGFSTGNRWMRSDSKFLRTIDRRGLDELAALLILTRAQEIQGSYMTAYRLRELLTDFFVEISHLGEFQAVAAQIYRQVYQLFISVYYKSSRSDLGLEFMLKNSRVDLDYTVGVIERISSREPSRNDAYSNILRGRRSLSRGGR
ncbi:MULTISPECIES: hypothetical protein [Pseudomonas]|uniref:hypothetical protein n=1 Tax=Pseudomonas TaxID=286 RepID=UPI000F548B6B|nr:MULTISPECIES: hypothetical protein [Pseudomonas]MCS7834835.1 hypothetical protein [Pseudomonas aeruginosa]TEC20828.1 hypothetical protein IPC1595_31640 [Pseudomonas aeruginosa]WVK94813.1 hypothetical protein SA496_06390 [Pseudomonas sp. JS3066]HBO1343777.1 hypothetical protein [Pseudomonas aeruginosa]HBO1588665.1 hypothetical protein [Pseudomonas aeruginosa]